MNEKKIRAGLLGERLGHSFSPAIHGMLADYSYELFEIPQKELSDFLSGNRFDALNVTIPYKQAVIPYLAGLSDRAARIGAVNTIAKKENGELWGDNTDYDGLGATIDDLGLSLAGKKVVILGSGGASRMAQVLTEDRGADVIVVSRSGENNYQNLALHADAALLINATPVGMYPKNGETPLSLEVFSALEAVIDLIYNPAKTALLLEAEKKCIPYRNGLLMLVSQAKAAAEIFTNTAISDTVVGDIAKKMAFQTQNIILIGMPGCGKTTLGKLLAAELGRPFADADAEIEKRAGRTIPTIFKEEGEAAFRALETAVLTELGSESGLVIATGGGVVTRPENYPLLKQNGMLLFLDIPPAGLPITGRPLSATKTPEALYAERLLLYRAFADQIIPVSRDISENLARIKEAIL